MWGCGMLDCTAVLIAEIWKSRTDKNIEIDCFFVRSRVCKQVSKCEF